MKEKNQIKPGKSVSVTMEPPLKLCNVCGDIRILPGQIKQNPHGEKETY